MGTTKAERVSTRSEMTTTIRDESFTKVQSCEPRTLITPMIESYPLQKFPFHNEYDETTLSLTYYTYRLHVTPLLRRTLALLRSWGLKRQRKGSLSEPYLQISLELSLAPLPIHVFQGLEPGCYRERNGTVAYFRFQTCIILLSTGRGRELDCTEVEDDTCEGENEERERRTCIKRGGWM